jgi:hypothetical protein
MKLFVKQDELAGVIQKCHLEISDCLNRLQVSSSVCSSAIVHQFIYLFDQITSHFEIHRWQSAFEDNRRIDNEYMIQYLGDLRNKQEILMNNQMQQTAVVNQILTVMQEVNTTFSSLLNRSSDFHRQNLPRHISTAAEHGLESNLYNLLRSSRSLLPNMNLKRGEVRRTSNYAVNGTSRTDVWEGCYLNEEKVAIRVLRAVYATPKTLKVHYLNIVVVVVVDAQLINLQRFKTEAEIWRRVFEADKGEHILTIYGFCQSDGEYPWVFPSSGTRVRS